MDNIENLQAADTPVIVEQPKEVSTAELAQAAFDAQVKEQTSKVEVEPETKATDRVRGPDGKFAKVDEPEVKPIAAKLVAPVADATKPVDVKLETPVAEVDPLAPVMRPPPGWSPASKVAFDALPESVKADIVKRESEVNQGLAKLQEYKPIEKYADMARQGNTTLDKALEQYVGIENLLRQDVVAGFERIAKNTGVDFRAVAQAYLARNGSAPQTGANEQPPQGYQQPRVDPNAIVSQAVAAFEQKQQARELQSMVTAFESDPKNRFVANVKPAMAVLLQNGMATDLQDAYDQACWANPEIRALINQPQPISNVPNVKAAALNQARSAAKATIGSPSSGFQKQAPNTSNMDTRSIAQAAYDAQVGRT
jgi:hypothetical protein